jgi:hypothetical protein
MKISLFYVGLLLLIIASCKKQNAAGKNIVEIRFNREALLYAQLPLHRYYIYKDSATGSLDSVIVTISNLYTYRHPGYKGTGLFDLSYDEYNMQVYQLELTNAIGQTTWFFGEARSNPDNAFPLNDTTAPFVFCAVDNLIPKTISRNNNCSYGFTYTPIFSTNVFLPNMTIEGKTYNDVFKVSRINGLEQDSLQSWYYSSEYYWAKNTGIIKRSVKTSTAVTTANLLRLGN